MLPALFPPPATGILFRKTRRDQPNPTAISQRVELDAALTRSAFAEEIAHCVRQQARIADWMYLVAR